METAFKLSDNLIAMKLAKDAGIDNVIQTARKMGITSTLKPIDRPRLALGNTPVKLLDLTSAYGVFANQGFKTRPHLINRVIDINNPNCDWQNYREDKDCQVVYAFYGDSERGLKPDTRGEGQVISQQTAKNMTKLLQATVSSGTAQNVNIVKAGGKTGTSGKRQDLWFVGYVPNDMVTGVWLGNPRFDRREEGTNVTSKDAAQVWNNYIKSIVN